MEKSLQSDVMLFGCFLALFVTLVACHPNVLSTREQSESTPSPLLTSPTGTDLQSKCLECHRYGENHHPIGITPSNPENYPFPLYNGEIMCLTCHIEDHLTGGVNLLRGGPYEDRRAVCFKCHTREEYAGINPHIMMDGRGKIRRVIGQPVCLVCHSTVPNPATDRADDVRFSADVAFLCWRCHTLMANTKFFESHFLKKPSGIMEKYIKVEEQKMGVTIPLVPRDRITCSTCHNPHQQGIIHYGPSASGADQKNRLRLPASKICIMCHNFNNQDNVSTM